MPGHFICFMPSHFFVLCPATLLLSWFFKMWSSSNSLHAGQAIPGVTILFTTFFQVLHAHWIKRGRPTASFSRDHLSPIYTWLSWPSGDAVCIRHHDTTKSLDYIRLVYGLLPATHSRDHHQHLCGPAPLLPDVEWISMTLSLVGWLVGRELSLDCIACNFFDGNSIRTLQTMTLTITSRPTVQWCMDVLQ